MRLDNMSCYVMTLELTRFSQKTDSESSFAFPFMYSKSEETIKHYASRLNSFLRFYGHLLWNIYDRDMLKYLKKNHPEKYHNFCVEERDKLSKNTNYIMDLIIKRTNSEGSKKKPKFNKFDQVILSLIDYLHSEGILETAWYKTSNDYNDGLFESNSIRDNFYMLKENIYMLRETRKIIKDLNKLFPVEMISEADGNKDKHNDHSMFNMVIEALFERIMLFLNSPMETFGMGYVADHMHNNYVGRELPDNNVIVKNFFVESEALRFYDFDCTEMEFHVHDEVMNFDRLRIFRKNRFDEDGTPIY